LLLPWLQSVQNMTPPGACCELCDNTDMFGQSCLDYAIHNRAWNIVEQLLMLGAMVVTSKWLGDSLIITAASNKEFSMVQMLLSWDADVEMPRMMDNLTAGRQVMYVASQNLRWHVVEALCEAGVDGRLFGHASKSPLMMAAKSGHWGTVALILDSVMTFKRPELVVCYPSSPKFAWLSGHTNDNGDGDDREEHVSTYGVDIDDCQDDDNNPVILAALAGEWDVVSFWLDLENPKYY